MTDDDPVDLEYEIGFGPIDLDGLFVDLKNNGYLIVQDVDGKGSIKMGLDRERDLLVVHGVARYVPDLDTGADTHSKIADAILNDLDNGRFEGHVDRQTVLDAPIAIRKPGGGN